MSEGNQSSNGSVADLAKMNQVLEELTPELFLLDESFLVRPRIAGVRALELSHIMVKSFSMIKAEVSKKFNQKTIQLFENYLTSLERYALAFYAAELKATNTWTNVQKERLLELASLVRASDRKFFTWGQAVFFEDAGSMKSLDDIRSGRGRRDDAEDVIRMVQMFQAKPDIFEQTPLTQDAIAQAEKEATEQIQLLDYKEDNDPKGHKELWHRAFSLWRSSYNELFDAARYAARKDPERFSKFPGISPSKK